VELPHPASAGSSRCLSVQVILARFLSHHCHRGWLARSLVWPAQDAVRILDIVARPRLPARQARHRVRQGVSRRADSASTRFAADICSNGRRQRADSRTAHGLLSLEDSPVQIRHAREFRRWLTIELPAGQIKWAWRRVELAHPRRRRMEQWKLFGAYLGCLTIAFSLLIGSRLVSGPAHLSWPVLAMLPFTLFFLFLALKQPYDSSALHRAARFMTERSSLDS
jgi:hypothetical protein